MLKGKYILLGSIVAFIAVFILSVGYIEFYRYNDTAEDVEGIILHSASMNDSAGIYAVSLSENVAKRQFFSVYADDYDYPFVQGGKFFCVGYMSKLEQSSLYMVKGANPSREASEVIAKVEGRMIFPVVSADLNTVYYIKENAAHVYSLFKYDRKEARESIVSEDVIDTFSERWFFDLYAR